LLFRALSIAWRNAAGRLAGGMFASACAQQSAGKSLMQADGLKARLDRQAGLPVTACKKRSYRQTGLWCLLFGLCMLPITAQAVPAGTLISNTATASFNSGMSSSSNTVNTVTVTVRTSSKLEFLQYAPASGSAQAVPVGITDYSTSGTSTGSFVAMPAPTPAGSTTPIDLSNPVPLVPVTFYHQGEPVFIRLTDLDQNQNATLVETVVVSLSVGATGDSEVLRLTETGPNTGVFTGYIQSYIGSSSPGSASPANGQLGLGTDVSIAGNYVDVADATDSNNINAMVDPLGRVFDSTTGLAVNGAQVTLIDAATNAPATVYGDDGISSFPSTITSGGTATDSSGKLYSFAAGDYRFPFVKPGTYRLQVTAPAAYKAPSVVPTAVLQALPGAPFSIDSQGSYGLSFNVPLGPAIQVDIPIDPSISGLYLTKSANKQIVAVGDFLGYSIRLSNNSGATASAARIVDTLPAGLRYQSGSATLNGSPVTDPVISSDGRSLTFNLNDVADGVTNELHYVTQVAVGTHGDKLVNQAVANANAGALVSNQATASVQLKPDLLNTHNILMGRVIADDCGAVDPDKAKGLAGVRIYLEDGTYVVTDEQGSYHIEGVKPGSHVLQIDKTTLSSHFEPVICGEHTRFAGRTFSRFIDLQAGSLWRADFHVRPVAPPKAAVELRLDSHVKNYLATYHLTMHGGDVPLRDMRLMINLPPDVKYIAGSSVLDNRNIDDPDVHGTVLIYRLGDVAGAWQQQLNFLARVKDETSSNVMSSKAFMIFNSPTKTGQRTPVVDTVMKRLRDEKYIKGKVSPRFKPLSIKLTEADKQELRNLAEHLSKQKIIRIEAFGHTDNLPIKPGAASQFADNFVLSVARAKSVAEYLAQLLELPESDVVVHGLGASQPYAPNTTAQERAENRRVELRIVTETLLDASQITDISSKSRIDVEVEGEWKNRPPADRKTSSEEVRQTSMPKFDKAWVEAANPGVELLWPTPDFNPPIPSIKVAVKHAPGQQLSLSVNGEPVSSLNYIGQLQNSRHTVAVSQWAGVDIEKGDNSLVIEVRDSAGKLVKRLQQVVHISSLPVRAELVEARSRLLADGKETPVIAVRLFDRNDRPIREGLVGAFHVDPPYVAQQDVDDLQRQPLSGLNRGNPRYRVGKDGIALIELKPTTRTGEATIHIPLQDRDATIRPWLSAAQRDWIMVGLAEGSVGHNTVSGNMASLAAANLDRDTYSNGKVSFFAKGSIQGKWLLTLAYNSDKDASERNTPFQAIDPNAYYPVYGDKTVQGHDASSREKLYIRLERRQFYALFGDYQTGMTVTDLARYDRTLTGYKSELHGEHYQLNVFASQTNQVFVRDEIRGDGTSGLYHLKYPGLIVNSETVRIETRDRFRPQIVLSSQTLARNTDYVIDYDAGTLFFRQPIASSDAQLNPIYIVIGYETTTNGAKHWTYGGRGAVKLMQDKLELGASYVNQGSPSGNDSLAGVDATLDISRATQVKLEYASTQAAGSQSRDAYRAELQHHSRNLEGKVYYREQETGFGLDQQSAIGTGMRLYGVDGQYHVSDRLDITSTAFRQSNLDTDANRDVAKAGVKYETKGVGASAGLQFARDSYSNGTVNRSEQLLVGAHKSVLDSRLNLRFDHAQSLSDNANADYPTRTVLGADYLLNPSTSLFVEQELTAGDQADTRSTRIGMSTRPWTGTTLNTSLVQSSSESGERLFAVAGLKQSWQLSDSLSLDASLDSSSTIKGQNPPPLSTSLPPAIGSTEDFSAVSLGGTYQTRSWSWTSRVERRIADSGDKWGLYSATVGEPHAGLGLSGRLQWYATESNSGVKTTHADLRLGVVRRPLDRRWTFLNRTDLAIERQHGGGSSDFDNRKIVNNLLVNYRADVYQLSTYYGGKYSRDTIDNAFYSGYTDSLAVELRRDLDKRWDLGARASTLHSYHSHQTQYAYGLSVGFSPATNMWLSLGYNWAGFDDDDFSMAGYNAQGVYLTLRFKFDQQSARDVAGWFNR